MVAEPGERAHEAEIAVIGAGVAGLAAARRLAAAGRGVLVIEKSRGLGGRAATRRTERLRVDHGAPAFAATGPAFRAEVERWVAGGHAMPVAPFGQALFAGVPGMSGIAVPLAEGLVIRRGARAEAMGREGRRWRIALEGGGAVLAEAVALAVPAPQAVDLLAGAEGCGAVAERIGTAEMVPCLSLIAGVAAWPEGAGPALRPAAGPIAAIYGAHLRGGSAAPALVAHGSRAFSAEHLEEDRAQIAARLLAALEAAMPGVAPVAGTVAGHRWRYARSATPLGEPCLWEAAVGLGACGDWCLDRADGVDARGGIEAAWTSGEALAARMA